MPSLELLIAQILTILVAARLIGWLFRKIHQPRVIGEMVAGILLGPSLFGWLALDLHATRFPPASLGYLSSLSYVGLLLFMFLIGLELDLRQLRELGRVAVITSQVSIILPFVFGSLFALYLYPRLSDPSVSIIGFVLFMGASMSVTAFPVLARILTEQICFARELVQWQSRVRPSTTSPRGASWRGSSSSFALPVWRCRCG